MTGRLVFSTLRNLMANLRGVPESARRLPPTVLASRQVVKYWSRT